MCHVLMKRMYILLFLGGGLCRGLSDPFGLMLSSGPLLIFCLNYLSNTVSGVLKSCTVIVWSSKSLHRSLETGFMNLAASVLGASIFRVVSSSC